MTDENTVKIDPEQSEDSASSETDNFHHQDFTNKFEPEEKSDNFEATYQGPPPLGLVNPALNISASLKVEFVLCVVPKII